MRHGNTILMANEATYSDYLACPVFANAFADADSTSKLRRCVLAPYGDWPHTKGMQRLTREDAVQIANDFNNPLTRTLTFDPAKLKQGGSAMQKVINNIKATVVDATRIMGLPWYVGHPDITEFKPRYTDGSAKGRIKSLEAADDGLVAHVKFNEDGEKMIHNESYHGHSVAWFLREEKTSNGSVWHPVQIKSVGFTNEPNIPVPPVTTANEYQPPVDRFARLAGMRLCK